MTQAGPRTHGPVSKVYGGERELDEFSSGRLDSSGLAEVLSTGDATP
jgi:hypothetical protein